MIVDCAAYRDGKRITGTLTLADVPRWLGEDDTFVWLGLRSPDRDQMAEVARALDLPTLDVDATVRTYARPRLEQYGDATWLVVRTAEYEDGPERLVLGEVGVLFDERFVVTVRFGEPSPLDGVRRELEEQPERLALGAGAVVAAVVQRVVDDYGPALDGFEGDVVEVEKDVFSDRRARPTQRLYRIKRQILDLFVVTDALRDPLERVLRHHPLMQHHKVDAAFRPVMDQLGRIVTRAQTLSDLIATAVNVNMTQVSLQQNEDMRKISAWVAIAAVPTMIAGIYGMNFRDMPELTWHLGYPATLLFMVVVCSLLYRAFRRSGWL